MVRPPKEMEGIAYGVIVTRKEQDKSSHMDEEKVVSGRWKQRWRRGVG